MQTGLIELPPRRIVPLRGWDVPNKGFYQYNNIVGIGIGSNITVALPVPHLEDSITYIALGGGGGAGSQFLAGNAPGGGGAGALVAATFRRPYPFDRVSAQIGYGGRDGAGGGGLKGGDSILIFYLRGVEIFRMSAIGGAGSAAATQSAGGAGGIATIIRAAATRIPQIARKLPPIDIVAKILLNGLDGEKGELRGNDIGGDGGDSYLGLLTGRYGDQVGGLGGLGNNASGTNAIGWGAGGGAGVGAGVSGDGKGGVVGLMLGRPNLEELI